MMEFISHDTDKENEPRDIFKNIYCLLIFTHSVPAALISLLCLNLPAICFAGLSLSRYSPIFQISVALYKAAEGYLQSLFLCSVLLHGSA